MQGAVMQTQPGEALARAKQGDQAAFAELVREHQAMVYSLARYFLRDAAIAEDVAQEVFLHLYQNLTSIESPAHLKFWLRKVAGHRCIDYTRRQKARPPNLRAVCPLVLMMHQSLFRCLRCPIR